jgi:hypothetical protein
MGAIEAARKEIHQEMFGPYLKEMIRFNGLLRSVSREIEGQIKVLGTSTHMLREGLRPAAVVIEEIFNLTLSNRAA